MPAAGLGDGGAQPAGGRRGGDALRIGLAQTDARIGDFDGNRRRMAAAAAEARARGAELVVFPELAVTGYPPRDLLLDRAFVDRAVAATAELARELAGGPPAVVGTVARSGRSTPGHPGLWNAAALLDGGRVSFLAPKRLLPSYDVFHETRWFVPGERSEPIAVGGRRIGLLVCEDVWDEAYPIHPPAELLAAGAEILVAISSSPFRAGILERRLHHARRPGVPLVYVNAAGANDELIFDGGSFVLDGDGRVLALLPRFEEAVEVVEVGGPHPPAPSPAPPFTPSPGEGETYGALVCGVRGFVGKNGIGRVFLGLSGGVDSALVACIAAEAVGAEAVTALAMPSRFTDPRSTESAREMAANLGIGFEVVPIEPLHAAFEGALADLGDKGTTDENLQARLRSVVLNAWVNSRGGLLLNTSNKTEISLGYGTLHGDLAGTLSVLGDVTKPEVYAMARWYVANRGPIPGFILDRPPTAELRPGQVDPFDYPVVAPAVEALVRGQAPGRDADRWRRMLRASESKRWQHGVILKVSERAFGTGRMVPITRVES
ncbi:MAG: NAD(+) synthase [Acidobacteriota bacterium]